MKQDFDNPVTEDMYKGWQSSSIRLRDIKATRTS